MTRYCPKCGEAVPTNSLTCPKCYAKIPPEPVKSEPSGSQTGKKAQRDDNRLIRLILSIIPGFFGFLGIGQIYRDYRQKRGYLFLLLGLVLFWSVIGLSSLPWPILNVILAFPPALLYLITFVISVLDSMSGFHMIFRR